jgi:hypothetical protein
MQPQKPYFNLFFIVIFLIALYTLFIDNCEAQWLPEVRLTNAPAASYVYYGCSWAVAANGNIVHVVWSDGRNGNGEIYYERSTDKGINWGTDTRLTNNSGTSTGASVAISGVYVHVIWTDTRDGNPDIYYKRSPDKGLSWGADTRLTNDINTQALSSLSVAGNFIHISWVDNRHGPYGHYEIYYKRSTNNGSTWEAETRMTNDSAESINASISSSGNYVHLAWNDWRYGFNDGNMEIMYKRSTNSGLNWSSDTRLTNNTAMSEYASVSASGLNVNVVWRDTRNGNWEIYYKRSSDAGINWGSDTRLTNVNSKKDYPNVVSNCSNIHVAWADPRDNNIYQVYYKRSTDYGVNWSADTRLTSTSDTSANPTLAISGTSVQTVWHDNRFGNYEVFYKSNPTGNTSPTYTISGQVTFKDNGQPVNSGRVVALHYDKETNNIIRVDSTRIQQGGYYTLPQVPQDTINIMYYQNDEDNLQFVPTYYKSAIDWQLADKIYPTENLTDIDGQVYRITNGGSSNQYISGKCYISNDLPVTPLKDVIIYARIGNEFINYGISNADGLYIDSKLPSGNYTLYAYRLGHNYLTRNVTLSGNNLDTIDFYFGPPIGIKNISETVPAQFMLYQNYPNPFNPISNIKFQMSNFAFANLKVYDVLGKEVVTLVNEQLKLGIYEVEFDGTNYPSGIYYYQFVAGDYTETKKMILVK